MTDLTEDVIVVPPASTADVLAPITSELLTYALLQNTTTMASAPPQLTYVSQGNYRYTFQQDNTATFAQLATATNVTPLSAASTRPSITELPVGSSAAAVPDRQPDPTEAAPSKRDDTVFLTPLPIITYGKPPTRATKNCPQAKSSNPNQNLLIKALLAQKSPLGPYTARQSAPRPAAIPAPRPATRTTTSFIIRASTKTPSGKTQIVNLPVSVSTPVSIVRNTGQGPVRPAITKKLLEEMAQRPATRSAFVKTTKGTEFTARNPATVVPSHATSTIAITIPTTITPHVSYSPSRVVTGAGTIVTTTLSIATAKPIMFTSTVAQKTRTTCFPTYTKTYIPVLTPTRKPKAAAANKTHKLIANKLRPACPSTCLSTPPSSATLTPRDPTVVTVAQCLPARARTNLVPGYVNRYLEPGEIPQVRKIPHRTFSGPRSLPAAVEQRAQLKAAKHAENHVESQATLQALQVHHGTNRAVLQATSLAALQAASQSRLESANQQAKNRAASQTKLPATSQSHFQVASLGKIQTVSLAQSQGILNVQLLTAAQSQLLATSQAQLQAISQAQQNATLQAQNHVNSQSQLNTTSQSQLSTTSQSQLLTVSQSQLTTTSQEQHHAISPVQLQATTQAQIESQADSRSSAQPNARTHHRLVIRGVATPHSVADAALVAPSSQSEHRLSTSNVDAASSSIHTTTTLTLSTGTTLIMPHYKTTVFKNLSSIAHAEPSRLVTPTTVAGAAERVVIRRPIAYFSARRSFPTQPSGTSTPVNVQRHIIRTIPRHILGSHLQPATHSPPVPRKLQVVSTSSTELPGSTTLSQNKP